MNASFQTARTLKGLGHVRRPYGTPARIIGSATPRYHPKKQKSFLGDPGKRGANTHCASGAGCFGEYSPCRFHLRIQYAGLGWNVRQVQGTGNREQGTALAFCFLLTAACISGDLLLRGCDRRAENRGWGSGISDRGAGWAPAAWWNVI